MVWSSINAAIAPTSAFVVTGSIGELRTSTPNRWHALSKAGWAVSGFTRFGRSIPRIWWAWSR